MNTQGGRTLVIRSTGSLDVCWSGRVRVRVAHVLRRGDDDAAGDEGQVLRPGGPERQPAGMLPPRGPVAAPAPANSWVDPAKALVSAGGEGFEPSRGLHP
jgi:hypothetical protein